MSVLHLAHKDFPFLLEDDLVSAALDKIRTTGLPHKIIYFYVLSHNKKLLGVVPARLLFIARLDSKIKEIMNTKVISLPDHTSPTEARQMFAKHKFLAFPIINQNQEMVGVVDIEQFAVDLGNIHKRTSFDDIYELIGIQDMTSASVKTIFLSRFPWLFSTLLAGTMAAFITGYFETTLQESIVLAFFLTMVLALNEAVTMQSATSSIQWFRKFAPTKRHYLEALTKESATASLIALGCGFLVTLLILFWKHDARAALTIGGALVFSIFISCLWGLTVPFLLRKTKTDPRVASAPLALALTDVSTLLIYFSLGTSLVSH